MGPYKIWDAVVFVVCVHCYYMFRFVSSVFFFSLSLCRARSLARVCVCLCLFRSSILSFALFGCSEFWGIEARRWCDGTVCTMPARHTYRALKVPAIKVRLNWNDLHKSVCCHCCFCCCCFCDWLLPPPSPPSSIKLAWQTSNINSDAAIAAAEHTRHTEAIARRIFESFRYVIWKVALLNAHALAIYTW